MKKFFMTIADWAIVIDLFLKLLAVIALFWIGYETFVANCIYFD